MLQRPVHRAHRPAAGYAVGWQGAGQSLSSGASPRWMVWLVAVMLFLLAATNGRPVRWSSGLFIGVLAPLLILSRGLDRVLSAANTRTSRPIFLALVLFFIANLVSAVVTPTDDAIIAVVLRCILPLLIYLSIVGLVLRQNDVVVLVFALAAGSAVIFGRGLAAYYAEWGIPDLQTVLWSRYNVERMEGYADATLGNLSHMGSYVVLVVPPLVLAAVTQMRGLAVRVALGLASVLGILNLVVSGSRTGLAIMLLALVMIVLSLGVSRAVTVAIILTAIALGTMSNWMDLITDPEVISRYLPSMGAKGYDNAADERLDSVVIGWQVFLDNMVFGVGPDMSREHNAYSIPHESIVHQLSELGLFGGATFIWLNLVIVGATFTATMRAATNPQAAYRLLWLIGPTCWLVFGITAGMEFNSSLALVWIGIAHAMLALSSAVVLPTTVAALTSNADVRQPSAPVSRWRPR